jgi:hypothetical protein
MTIRTGVKTQYSVCTTMLNSLKDSDMKKAHQDQIDEMGFLAACTDKAVKQMNDCYHGRCA